MSEQGLDRDENKDICVVGYSLRAPNCSSVEEFASALRDGKDLTTSATRYPQGHLGLPPRQGRIKDEDIGSFDEGFFGLSYKQAEKMDPLIRMLLQVSYEALMDARLEISSLRGSNTGVYVGHCFSDSVNHKMSALNPDKTGYELVNGANSMAANRISYFYDFCGPSMSIDTACSSSLVALHYAVSDLTQRVVDRAIVAGLSLTSNPHLNHAFHAFHMLSPTGHCHAFDERADGYCRSDGVACVVLERGSQGYAIVAGTGTNADGYKADGITFPSATQQAQLMNQVFARTPQVPPSHVTFHEAHGTGTVAGDKVELEALARIYGANQNLVVGSLKSNMGHSEGASGLFGLIKILLMYEDRTLFPNFGFQSSPHSLIANGTFTVLKTMQEWEPTAATLSSFGFGGANAFAILQPCASPRMGRAGVSVRGKQDLQSHPFSASAETVAPMQNKYSKYFKIQESLGNHIPFRYAWRGETWQEYSPLVFVCNGQGSQWNNMGRDLIQNSEEFRSTMERLEALSGIPLVELYLNGSKWMSKDYSAVGIVSFQLGLLSILRKEGIYPDIFLGHSVGELVCPFLAGLATEADVLRFASIRSKSANDLDSGFRLDIYHADSPSADNKHDYEFSSEGIRYLVKRVSAIVPRDSNVIESYKMEGDMVVIGCTAEAIDTFISDLGLRHTRCACYNAPDSQTVSGPSDEVKILVDHCLDIIPNVFVRWLPTDKIAYHSKFLHVFRETLRERFGQVECTPLSSSWISTSRNDSFSVEYLIENIVGPVYFQEAIEKIPHGATVVEIGPANILLSQIKRTRRDLSLISMVEKNLPFNIEDSLDQLKQWKRPMNGQISPSCSAGTQLHYSERYPRLWSSVPKYGIPSWGDFELPRKTGGGSVPVVYDLTQKPWSCLRDHVIRGQNLFPATGYIHAMWSAVSFARHTEISNMRIFSPLAIQPSEKYVKLSLQQTGTYCELWDEMNQIRYASATVCLAAGTVTGPPSPPSGNNKRLMDGIDFYLDLRRLGYEYGQSFQLVDQISSDIALLSSRSTNWICYMDCMLHLLLLNETSHGLPVGFDRVVMFESTMNATVDELWVMRPRNDTVASTCVLIEGLRMQFLPTKATIPTIHKEVFVQYNENDSQPDCTVIAALLRRESPDVSIVQPLKTPELQQIADKIQLFNLAETNVCGSTLIIADSSDVVSAQSCLLLTVDLMPPKEQHALVASWQNVRLFRLKFSPSSHTMICRWEDVAQVKGPIIWKADGASGAISSLCQESKEWEGSMSYEGNVDELVGVEKGMRHNFVMEDGRHGVWVDVEDVEAFEMPSNVMPAYAALRVVQPGRLESLEWVEIDPRAFSVKVSAASLNFRDVMRAMGRLKERDLSLGLEFSGTVQATGQRVFGVAKNALASHCTPLYSFATPTELSDEEAASIPVVYLTAYYALVHKAQCREGQSVLIHAGSGGVGMAAIRVAQKRGLKVFTTCSSSKRQFLKENFCLEDHQIGDSRCEAFLDTVLSGTNQRGVHIVLNSLAGSLQKASLRCLAPGGHFCEIGKFDVMENSEIALGLLAANISFHVIDLLPLLSDSSHKPLWDSMLRNGFEAKEIVPLPVTTFKSQEIVEAFRSMSQGKHVGKIVVTNLGKSEADALLPLQSMLFQETHLVTGGLGGVGLALASRLAENGCRHIILVGRRGVTTEFQRNQITNIEARGCRVDIFQTDLLALSQSSCNPQIIWHVATVYRDAIFSEMTSESWDQVMQTKVDGYWHLRKTWPSAHIVAISSVAAYFGNSMQVNYAMANAAMDAAARSDPKALSIRLGPLDDVGFITRGKAHRVLLESVPFHLLRIDNVLEGIVKLVLTRRLTGVLGLYECKRAALESNAIETSPQTITYTLQEAQKFMSIVLGGTPNQYPPDKSLKAAGLDSLSTMEVVHHINEQTRRKKFTPSDVTETFTVQDLVETINQDRDFRSLYDDSKASTPVIPKDMKSYHAPQEVKKDAAKNQTGDVTNFKIPPLLKDFEGVKKALTEAKILILRQEDARIFNHGAPIDTGDEDDVARFIDEYVALVEAFENSEAVVVAVIQGEVRGGGMIFPGMADVCLATGCASFGLPEIHRGMIPAIVSRTLVDRLGKAATRRMALTGECINAQRAMEMGLIDRVLDDCEEVILREVENLVRRWEKGTCIKAARTIKTELIPRNVARPRAMGTVMGTWLRQKRDDEKSTPNLEILDLSIENKVATLTMRDSLGQNTLRSEMTEAIRELIPRLQREARAIILTSGHNNFHVGLNPSRAREWAEQNLPISYVAAKLKETYMGFIELATLGIPIICVLNGKVHGGGLPIAFWCDYRIACFDVDMHFGNISRGMSPAGQLSRLFREYLSPTELMKAYLQNSHWTCDDLLRLGLVSGVALNRDEALSEAQRLGSFIAEQQTAAVRDTLYLMKLSYVADIADEESWLIAKKICNENISEIPFAQPQNESFVSNLVDDERSKEDPVPVGLEHKAARTDIGIIAMEVYTPRHAISADELERKGIPAKSKNGQLSVAVWDAQEDSISMALTACSQLLKNHVKDPYKIGRIEVGTESNVDMAKSIKSYLMDLLPNDHVDVEGVDNTNACYGGTAALLNALAWCRETGRDAIVVATDTADMDLVDSGWRGAAAVAMLVGYDPWITIHRRRVSCFKNTDDFFKPRSSSKKSPVIKTRQSMDHYIYALDHTINAMSRHGLDMKSVEAFVFHGGLCAAFMRLVERHLTTSIKSIKTWENHFECARSAANQIGGMYTASLYVNLASLLAKISSDPPQVSTLCLFSYGSGSTATLLHATVHHKEGHSLNLFDQLAGRAMVSYDTLSAIVDSSDSDKKAILRRFPGVYYRKLDREGKVERTYYKEP